MPEGEVPCRPMGKSADFDSANPGSSPGGATSTERVEVDCVPQAPKTQPELYLALMCAMEDASKYMLRYLETGDTNDACRAANGWMIVCVLKTRYQCEVMWGGVIAGMSPISEEQRQTAKKFYFQSK